MARTPPPSSYPFELMGAPASPPERAPADLVMAWREYEAEEAADLGDELISGAADWRPAASLMVLLAEADAANPDRDRRSDGGIGDPRHQAKGAGSDHNPWLKDAKGVGVLRARDFDADGLDVPGAFERMRAKAAAGQLPQLLDGGYLIHAGRITAPDFTGWHVYTGDNPHVTFGHVSVSRDPRRFDDRRAWDVWPAAAAPARPARPARPAPAADLRGRYFELRGEEGAEGPRVQALQRFLVRVYPAYARGLDADGVWGPRTSGVIRQFAQRSGIRSADGRNIGPQVARRLYLSGFRA